jgi:hypothetical protein
MGRGSEADHHEEPLVLGRRQVGVEDLSSPDQALTDDYIAVTKSLRLVGNLMIDEHRGIVYLSGDPAGAGARMFDLLAGKIVEGLSPLASGNSAEGSARVFGAVRITIEKLDHPADQYLKTKKSRP